MNKEKFISIIIPAFNVEDYLDDVYKMKNYCLHIL